MRADLVEQGGFGRAIWTDKDSGAPEDGSLWWVQATTQGVTGYFKAQNSHDSPNAVYGGLLSL